MSESVLAAFAAKGVLSPKEVARWIHLRGFFWDGAMRGLFLVDLHRASLV